jgi:hypothetical protein
LAEIKINNANNKNSTPPFYGFFVVAAAAAFFFFWHLRSPPLSFNPTKPLDSALIYTKERKNIAAHKHRRKNNQKNCVGNACTAIVLMQSYLLFHMFSLFCPLY